MKRLPDDAYVSTLSIPGTHDSGTGNGFVSVTESIYGPWGDKFARTQDISMQEQWEMGIRAFGIQRKATSPAWFTLDGKPVSQPQNHGLYLMRGTDGTVRKVLR